MNKIDVKQHILPFSLSIIVVILDQLTKYLITLNINEGNKIEVLGDFIWFVHIRNRAFVFGWGDGIPEPFWSIFSIIIPLGIVAALIIGYFFLKDLSEFQKWCLIIAVGGGTGNLLDRIFRSKGVVDFISVKMYGFLGFERWYAFNIADSTIVVMLILLTGSLIFNEIRNKNSEQKA